MSNEDLGKVPTIELQRAAGIMKCEQMLYARPAHAEAYIDALIARIEAELERRKMVDATGIEPVTTDDIGPAKRRAG